MRGDLGEAIWWLLSLATEYRTFANKQKFDSAIDQAAETSKLLVLQLRVITHNTIFTVTKTRTLTFRESSHHHKKSHVLYWDSILLPFRERMLIE